MEKMPNTHPHAKERNLICGKCQWFSAGFDGQNCRMTRGVEVTTPACVEYTHLLDDPFSEIVHDKYIQGIRKELKHSRFRIDDQVVEELKGYIINDKFHKTGTSQDIEATCDMLKQVVSYRSRVSQIYTSLVDVKYEFKEMVDHASMWLYSKYDVLRALKNETQREAAFHRLIPEMVLIQKKIDKTISLAKYVDDRLDTTDRTLSRIVASSEKLFFLKEGPRTGPKVYV